MPKIPKFQLTAEQRAIVEQVREAALKERQQIVEEQRALEAAHDASGVQLRRAFELLRAVRRERGISLATVSTLTGISKPALSRLENNPEHNATLTTLTRVAEALDCELQISIAPRTKVAAEPKVPPKPRKPVKSKA